jgi:hypothetical protein
MLTEIIKKIGAPEKALVKKLNPNFETKLPQILPQPWKKVSVDK